MAVKARRVPALRGRRVTLRPYRPAEYRAVVDTLRTFGGWAAGPPSAGRLRRRVRRSGWLWRGRVVLGIEAEGRLVGEIQTYHHAPMPRDTVGLGILLFDPADRGRGLGTEATALLSDWVLRSGAATRIEAGTAPRNAAMRRVLERTGWRHTGTERSFGRVWATYERTAEP